MKVIFRLSLKQLMLLFEEGVM